MNYYEQNIEKFPILLNDIESVDFEGIAEYLTDPNECGKLSPHILKEWIIKDCTLTREWWEQEWYPGSLLYSCGLTLHAIIAAIEPKIVVEIGSFLGMSTCFIADSLSHEEAHIDSVDIWAETAEEYLGVHRGHTIKRFPPKIDCVSLITAHGEEYLKTLKSNSVDFIFEDANHTYETTKAIIEQVPRVLKIGGILASHDALVKPVAQAYENVFRLKNCKLLSNGMILWKKS